MAKKKAASSKNNGRGAKTAIVQELISQGKSNQEIIAALQAQGMSISATYLYSLRSKTSGGKRRKKRRRKASAESASTAPRSNVDLGANGLRNAINFCKSVGGLKQAEKLLETLKEIKSL